MMDPYATGVLVPEHHDRLVKGIDGFAEDAGIHKRWIWTPLAETCGDDEISYVRKFRHHLAGGELAGLCFTGEGDVSNRMSAIAGALVRNFVQAQVMMVGQVIDSISGGNPPNPTCLLISNFFQTEAEGWTLPRWQVTHLLNLLNTRAQISRQTVLYVSDMTLLAKGYGSAFVNLIQTRYQTVGV